jgi:hypothetical protein
MVSKFPKVHVLKLNPQYNSFERQNVVIRPLFWPHGWIDVIIDKRMSFAPSLCLSFPQYCLPPCYDAARRHSPDASTCLELPSL